MTDFPEGLVITRISERYAPLFLDPADGFGDLHESMSAKSVERVSSPTHFAELQLTGSNRQP